MNLCNPHRWSFSLILSDRSECEPVSLRFIIWSIDKKIQITKLQKYGCKIMGLNESDAFQLTQNSLRTEQKWLKKQKIGTRPWAADPILEMEFCTRNASLAPDHRIHFWIQCGWLILYWGVHEPHELKWGDIIFHLKKRQRLLNNLKCVNGNQNVDKGEFGWCQRGYVRRVHPKFF